MNLEGKNICVYDLEIKEEIDGKNITWADKKLMGISVGVRQEKLLFEHAWNELPVKTTTASQPWLLMSPRFL